MKRRWLVPAVLIFGALMSSCAVRGAYVSSYGPPPRYGVIGVAPGSGFVWAEGFWDWRGGRYVWVSGRWMRPPRSGAVWVPGAWEERHEHGRRGWEFRRGHWR